MENFFDDCLERFQSLHNEIKIILNDLPGKALDWQPADETNSISVLVTHLAAAEKFWAVDVALGRKSDRVRSEEFNVGQASKDELIARLDGTMDELKSAFSKMTLKDLNQMRYSQPHQLQVRTAWAVLHALEHSAIHTGHIQLTAQLWALGNGLQKQ